MRKNFMYLAALTLIAGTLSFVSPVSAYAAPEAEQTEQAKEAEASADIEEDADEEPGDEAESDDDFAISDDIKVQGPAVVQEALAAAKEAAESQENAKEAKREYVVDYAMQFVGGKYRAGGNDPHTGVDCSGFVKYVMQNGAGVSLSRSSASMSSQGVAVSVDQMQPGDLLFYSNGSRINHVGMYIGDGQIVHASTYSTGIKVSPWNYRAPVRIMNVLG